jgi:arabinogalactan endo-1,4-beta-galactosidase
MNLSFEKPSVFLKQNIYEEKVLNFSSIFDNGILSEITQFGNVVGNGTHGCSHTNTYHNKCNQCFGLCTSNIYKKKKKKLQMELHLNNVIFNVLVYIF